MVKIILYVCVLAFGIVTAPAVFADTRQASVEFTNRVGERESWLLQETVQQLPQGRAVQRVFKDQEKIIYREDSLQQGGRLVKLEVEDNRPGGESVLITTSDHTVTFAPAGSQENLRSSQIEGDLVAFGQVAGYLTEILQGNPDLPTHSFFVPVPKALKAVAMQATFSQVNNTTFDVILRSPNVVVRTFFMKGDFKMTVDRSTGRLIRFAGQVEPYDLSSGRARSFWTEHTFQ